MRCDEFEQRWNDALDDRVSPQTDRALTAHAALCPHCAELLNTSDLLARAFPPRATLTPSAGWREATVNACVVEQALQALEPATEPVLPLTATVSAKSNRPWYVAAAVAAGLLVAIVLGNAWNRPGNDQQQPRPEQFVNQQPPVAPAPILNKTPNGTSTTAPASDSILALASLNREQLSMVGYQVSDGLRPVTMGVSNAWESIKRPLNKSEMDNVPAPQENGRSSSWNLVRESYV